MTRSQDRSGPVRVAHLVSHPIQYFAPLYRELARRPEIELTVYFYSDATVREFHDEGFDRPIAWDVDLLGGYPSRVLPSATRTSLSGRFLRRPNWDIVRGIASGKYDVVWVHGYAHLTTWLAILAARAAGSRVLIREEQTLLNRRTFAKRVLKQVALRLLFTQVAGLYIGEYSREYFEHFGIRSGRLFPARYCVDNEFFQSEATRLRSERAALRARFGIEDDGPVVLFSGKLVEKKQPQLLIEAFARLQASGPCWLLFAGDGPLRGDLLAAVEAQGLSRVRFAGFLGQREVRDAYGVADVLVLPSRTDETWGLVVNEAMNFSLPVIVSDKVGCAPDLVRDGWNGFVVPHNSVSELSKAMARVLADLRLRRQFGARSRRIVEHYSIEACATEIVHACIAMADRRTPESPFRLPGARGRLARVLGTHLRVPGVDRVARALLSPDRDGVGHGETVVTSWDGTRYWVDTRSFIEWRIYVYGEYERSLLKLMHSVVRAGDVVVDCGANMGVHTCSLARRVGGAGVVVAIEPIEELADRLNRNRQLNGLSNVIVVDGAASSSDGHADLFIPELQAPNQGQATFLRGAGLTRSRRVSIERIDSMLTRIGVESLSLIKLDIEGHELDALRGAQKSIARWQPMIVFEFNPSGYDDAALAWRAFGTLLSDEHGYSLTGLGPNGVRLVATDGEQPGFCTVLATPRGRLGRNVASVTEARASGRGA